MHSISYLLPPLNHQSPTSPQIVISGIPAENGKCRVETQLKIGFHLKSPHGDAVMKWKQIKLPRSLIAKEKHRIEKFNGRDKHLQDSEILTLETRLVCDHDMSKVLECCDNCIGRERKRAHRRKESQKLPGPLGSIPVFGAINRKNSTVAAALAHELNPPTPTDPAAYQAWERSRIMVFSSTEYVDISTGECILPTRITCYCRHHNEKVGFRIQFTARDSTGAFVASVLTNPVMMMDDHKSGKRAAPNAMKTSIKQTLTLATTNSNDGQDDGWNQDDAEDDDYILEDQEDLDLEAGHYLFKSSTTEFQDENAMTEPSSPNMLTLQGSTGRMTAKRRVADEDLSMEDIQTQQQPSRRKTSHDTTHSTQFTSSAFALSPSPFMPGSPFAIDEERNVFTPSFAHAMLMHNGGMLQQPSQQHNNNMFNLAAQRNGSIHSVKDMADQDQLGADAVASLMNFTTLEESMPSHTSEYQSPSISTGLSSQLPTSTHFPTRSSISIPMAITSTPFLYQSMSQYSTNYPSPLDESDNGLHSSFLDVVQMQEFHNFQRQSLTQQQQQQQHQQILMQLQQQAAMESKQAHWISPEAEKRDPFQSMGITTSPSSEAFIPIPVSLPDNIGSEYNCSTALKDGNSDDASSQAPKKRGRPRKGLTTLSTATIKSQPASTTTSGASSPMISPKAPSTNMPPSPSPPPYMGYESAVSTPTLSAASLTSSNSLVECVSSPPAAAAAQFLMLHQQQQQMQQQQKQAILARQSHQNQYQHQQLHHQKPRVQKLIPARGSIEGGDEITLLGTGFFPGMVPTFDGVPAIGVQFYGTETIICKLPPRACPGVVVVKAHQQQQTSPFLNNGMSAAAAAVAAAAAAAASSSVKTEDEGSSSGNELVRALSQFFGGSSAASISMPNDYDFEDHDVGVLFEYEEDKGDRDLIALALQVLGMKMNGRVESPHQVAMRIMATASAQQQQLAEQQQQQRQLHQQQHQQQPQQTRQKPQKSTVMAANPVSSTAMTTTTKSSRSYSPATSSSASPAALTPIQLHSPQSLQTESFAKPNSFQNVQQQQQQQRPF
ncbi:SPT3 Dosage dependent suppressor of Ty-induced promoter mutations-like protein [Mortierella sp. AM989]|nr:SPT3 Dosage dependent suppressor of Ty-induced promoter mutations-like protein [Mortierella sp. AM989]